MKKPWSGPQREVRESQTQPVMEQRRWGAMRGVKWLTVGGKCAWICGRRHTHTHRCYHTSCHMFRNLCLTNKLDTWNITLN